MNMRLILLITGSLLLLLIVAVSLENYRQSSRENAARHKETVVRVSPFLQECNDQNISWVTIAAERKLIELLAREGVTVLSPLTPFKSNKEPEYHFTGRTTQKDSLITVIVTLSDSNGTRLTSDSLSGTIGLFRKIRNVIGETVAYALEIDPQSLKIKKTKLKPTRVNSAYALYLRAKQKITAKQPDRAIACLKEAISYDPHFAMAQWTISQIYKEKGVADSAMVWDKKAKETDLRHPQWPWKDSVNREQPLKDLLNASRTIPFVTLEPGILYRNSTLKQYGLTAVTWIIDLRYCAIDMVMQKNNSGNYIAEFLADKSSILAMNGGFFEMDRNHCLSPSGLIAQRGNLISPISDRGGSGIFSIKNGVPKIIWAKDSINPSEYDLAFQSGPVIVEPGGKQGIYNNSFRRLNRSAIGVSEGKVILTIVVGMRGAGLSLYEFAEFLRKPRKEGGAGCDAALNLDGGSSTQVSFRYRNATLTIPGLWAINSAIVVRRKAE